MSHFTCAVFTDDLNKLDTMLEPYYEQVEEGSPYAVWEEDDSIEEGGYYINPNAKWDWWSIGGRWSGMLRLKDGKTVEDFAKVRDVDFTPDPKEYEYALRFWEINVEGKPKPEDDSNEYFNMWKPEYYTERYANKEEYALYQSAFRTFAFIDEYGEWHEEGEMGWFGFSSSTQETHATYNQEFERYLAEAAEKDLYIIIVDCHI